MHTVLCTAALSDRYHNPAESLRKLAACGALYYDRSFGLGSIERDDYREFNLGLRDLARSLGMVCSVTHAPGTSTSPDPEKDKRFFRQMTRSIECAALYGAPAIVIHPSTQFYPFAEHREEAMERTYRLYRDLLPYAQEYGVKICTENIMEWNGQLGHCIPNACGEIDDFCQVIDAIGTEWMGACLDTGHSFLARTDTAEMIRRLGKERLYMLHIHDNQGLQDTHSLPYFGSIDFAPIMKALGEIEFDGLLDFETFPPLERVPEDLVPDILFLTLRIGASMERQIRAAYPSKEKTL